MHEGLVKCSYFSLVEVMWKIQATARLIEDLHKTPQRREQVIRVENGRKP